MAVPSERGNEGVHKRDRSEWACQCGMREVCVGWVGCKRVHKKHMLGFCVGVPERCNVNVGMH